MDNGATDDRKAAYQAWAERLKSRGGSPPGQTTATPEEDEPSTESSSSAGYWSPESLYRDSEIDLERQRREEAREKHINELLAVLDLPAGSTLQLASDRVKQLARELHPDSNLTATSRTGQVQLDRMVEINNAYDELKRLLS